MELKRAGTLPRPYKEEIIYIQFRFSIRSPFASCPTAISRTLDLLKEISRRPHQIRKWTTKTLHTKILVCYYRVFNGDQFEFLWLRQYHDPGCHQRQRDDDPHNGLITSEAVINQTRADRC